MIKRLIAMLALAVAVTGCGLLPKLDSVPLLTWTSPDAGGCFPETVHGLLTVDPTYGTDLSPAQNVLTSGGPYVVAWPHGYTARRVGDEVQVLDETGKVRAVTGQAIDTGESPAGFGSESIEFSMPVRLAKDGGDALAVCG